MSSVIHKVAGDDIPLPVSSVERWIVEHRVVSVKTSFKMTSADTADDYITLTDFDGVEVTWLQSTFNSVATLRLNGLSLCEPKYGLREKVAARDKYERDNSEDLATYKRLKKKFEGVALGE